MPWLTSILVLHPRISTEMAGALGILVDVEVPAGITGVSEGKPTNVGAVVAVINGMGVDVAGMTCGVGVALATPITTGVAVKIEGVFVGGRNGVGGLNGPGWMTQPLQEAVSSIINRRTGMVFFISSPSHHCTPHVTEYEREETCRGVSRLE
jgi:hypothetical protein